MIKDYDVAIVGAGIIGLAHAWIAAKKGYRVIVFEKSAQARGASVRNFGMIWPIGQTVGENLDIAMVARDRWLELGSLGVVDVEKCGSLHLAHREDEWAVLQEFSDLGTHPVTLLNSQEILSQSTCAQPQQLLGGLWSSSELRVDPRVASQQISRWLEEEKGVEFCFETPALSYDNQVVRGTSGALCRADRVIVCSGSDIGLWLDSTSLASDIRLCKLQMLKARGGRSLGGQPHLASGLTLRHYQAFEACPSLPLLQQRIASETPELDTYGIHVMATFFPNGDILLGDSHEYGSNISPFQRSDIDDLILRELRKILRLEDWTIYERWYGVYGKHVSQPVFEKEIEPSVKIMIGTGGSGMTMSFGLAERAWKKWWGE